MLHIYRNPVHLCPKCGYRLDAHGTFDVGGAPAKDDVTVCSRCTAVLQFGENLHLVPVSPEEFEKLPTEVKLSVNHIIKAIKAIKEDPGG